MKLGIVGLPNAGKSTMFNALTKAKAESANYPFSTKERNVGMVSVPDKRIDSLAEMYSPHKVTPATIEFVDIAGLVSGASTGEGLGNKFLTNIREVDAIVHVVRCFDDDNVVHVDGSIDPIRDVETINLELIFSDMELLEKKIDKTRKMIKGDKRLGAELEFYEKIYSQLERSIPARAISSDLEPEQEKLLNDLFLLTSKLVLYVANMSESEIADYKNNARYMDLKKIADADNALILPVCAKAEEDIAQLDEGDKALFLEDMGLTKSGLDRIIEAGYELLGLISFLTAGPKEVRAWTIKKGLKAPQAAGKIHTDFEKGFIRVEIVAFDDLMSAGSYSAAREKAYVRLEGREYVIKDGDVALFRFNV
ncbi:MAG: redox-regulated ATPase YchF [Oscillospiraceae bacterium]|nr:redox-regulated ATPase YchF [Oscillospiraceae bacterium]